MSARDRIRVVGAGVIGLTTAVVLAERGDDVEVWAARPPAATTSAVAAAIWYPYRVEPPEVALPWATRSFAVFSSLAGAARAAAVGVRMAEGVELFRAPRPDPWWRDAVPDFGRVDTAALPEGFADGYALRLPVVAMERYLAALTRRLEVAGGRIEVRRLDELDAAAGDVAAVVDCTGIGARELLGDPLLRPVRGQVVVVRNPGLQRFLIADDGDDVRYVIPRGEDVVCGGTAQEGAESLDPDPEIAASILARCCELEPRLGGAEVIAHRVGLRPARSPVRLEAGVLGDGTPVVHQYGHGGAGVTLSWGSAEAAVALLDDALGRDR